MSDRISRRAFGIAAASFLLLSLTSCDWFRRRTASDRMVGAPKPPPAPPRPPDEAPPPQAAPQPSVQAAPLPPPPRR